MVRTVSGACITVKSSASAITGSEFPLGCDKGTIVHLNRSPFGRCSLTERSRVDGLPVDTSKFVVVYIE